MILYVAAMPQDAEAAGWFGHPVAHMAYRVGAGDLRLLRGNTPAARPGDLMVVDDRGSGVADGDPVPLVSDIQDELSRRGYAGLLTDFERPPGRFAEAAHRELKQRVPVMFSVQTLVPCIANGALLEEKLKRSLNSRERPIAAELIRPGHRLADIAGLLVRLGFDAAFLLYSEITKQNEGQIRDLPLR